MIRSNVAMQMTCLLVFGAFSGSASAETVVLDSRATFLRTNGDPDAVDAEPIELASLGLMAGDTISLQRLGNFDFGGPFPENATLTVGVFAASADLGPVDVLDRVVDAIDAGDDADTPETFYGELSTSIPEAFYVDSRAGGDDPAGPVVTLQIPDGATHLFLAAGDRQYSDNVDSDADYGVEITLEAAMAGVVRTVRVAQVASR